LLWRDLTDKQWDIVKTIFPPDPVREDGRGRPWTDQRTDLNGILWILRTGVPWADLPERYGSYQTVHRRFHRWRKEGVEDLLVALAEDLRERGRLNLEECFIEGTFVSAKKGGAKSGRPSGAKGTKIMTIVDGNGLPVAGRTESASPAEVTGSLNPSSRFWLRFTGPLHKPLAPSAGATALFRWSSP
jgi:transposase